MVTRRSELSCQSTGGDFPGLRHRTTSGLVLSAVLAIGAGPALVLAAPDTTDANAPPPYTIMSRDVVVQVGDTLRAVAQRELGRSGFAPQLAEFNSLVESAPLTPGDIIRVPIHVPERGETAEVIFVKGEAVALREERGLLTVAANASPNSSLIELPLSRGSEVFAGDILQTGSDGYLSIEFSAGSVINLQPDSAATVSRLHCLPSDDSCLIHIQTSAGKVSSDINARDDQPVDYRISTPYASAAVRGTVFDVEAQTANLLIGVTEGDVDVAAEGELVPLDSGFGSVVEEGLAPSQPIALLPAPVFRRVPSRVAPGDFVAWWPLQDAERYGAKLSNDEAGLDAFASFEVNADTIGFENIDTGDYYLTVRALDENGLRGFTSNTRITIAEIDPSIAAVQTTVEQAGREFLVTVIDPPEIANGFEIQVSGTEDFSNALSVDVNQNGTAVFRLDSDQVFARARALIDPFTVSSFGDPASSDN